MSFVEKSDRVQQELKRSESITAVVQLMESERNFDEILDSAFNIIGDYLEVSNIIMFECREDKVNTIKEYVWNDGENIAESLTPYMKDILKENPDDLYVVPIGDMATEEEVKVLSNLKVNSILTIPLVLNGRTAMHAVFAENKKKRVWHSHSILFVADVCKVLQSILEKRISNNSLVSSYTALREILNNIGSGIYVVEPKTKEILFCNEIMKRIVKEDMVGKHCWDYHLGERNYNCDNCPIINNPTYYREVYDNKLDIWFDVKNTEITWVNGSKVSLCTMTDITEKKKYEKRIEFQANNDFLTGLYNRMRCESDLSMCIEEAIATEGKGALLFIDLDDFKHINDGLGHQYGDLLLKMISVGLQQIGGIEEHCYRVGGDEFIVIVNPNEIEKTEKIVKAIMQLFDNPWSLNGADYYCKMSMGVVFFPDEGNEVHELIKKADIAMYDAKKSGKNQFRYYNASEEDKSVKRLDIEKNMRSAISVGCNEFEIYIQPIVDAATAKCVGGEALIRWNSGNLGFLGPTEFIPLAEHLGLITPIGSYFLRKACEANKRWSDRGIDKHLHVNLSVVQLMKNSIVDDVRDIIEETGVKPENIVLEITENLAINDMTRVKNIIKALKAIGVSIALDDFGTGYSSLNYIKQLDLDIIKVDRTFITDIVSDDYAQVFVKLITELSEKLDVSICIEGVEDKAQYKVLKKMGVKTIQGFYFGKPMPLYEFEEKFLQIAE